MSRPASSSAATRSAGPAFDRPSANCRNAPTSSSRTSSTACQEDLERWEANVRPGTLLNCGPAIGRLADRPDLRLDDTAREAIERIQADLRTFRDTHKLDQVVVLNVVLDGSPLRDGRGPRIAGPADAGAGPPPGAAAGVVAVRLGRPRSRSAVHQFHALARRIDPGPAGAGPAAPRRHRRQGRQDRRDPHEERARPHVRPAQLADAQLGRPQHLRQPRRPGPRRSGQQGVEGPHQGPGHFVHRRLQAADAGDDRVHRVAGRLEDGVEPHPLSRAFWARR